MNTPTAHRFVFVDHEKTAARRAALATYCEEQVASHQQGLVCRHADHCLGSVTGTDFYAGQMGHVGHHYDMRIDGTPLRVLIVGQEFGRDPNSIPIKGRGQGTSVVTVDERHADIVDYRGGQLFKKLNPHMRGTTMAMHTILDVALARPEPDRDPTDHNTLVGDQAGHLFHHFDAMAFTNLMLCSATEPGVATGASSQTMKSNCLEHFVKTIELLEPTLIVIQKTRKQVLSQRWLGGATDNLVSLNEPETVYAGDVGGRRVVLCVLNHPAAKGAYGWQWATSPYWTATAKPSLVTATEQALAISPPD